LELSGRTRAPRPGHDDCNTFTICHAHRNTSYANGDTHSIRDKNCNWNTFTHLDGYRKRDGQSDFDSNSLFNAIEFGSLLALFAGHQTK